MTDEENLSRIEEDLIEWAEEFQRLVHRLRTASDELALIREKYFNDDKKVA